MAIKRKKRAAVSVASVEMPAAVELPVVPRWVLWASMGVLAVLVFGIYFQTYNHAFINLDDHQYIADNPPVRSGLSLANIRWAILSVKHYYWQPATWVSHMIDCQLFGLNAGPHHLMNALLHAVNGALLAWTLFYLTGSVGRSVFAAALFTLHPLRVESVAWAAERKDVLSGLFWILAIAAYGYYAKAPSMKRYLVVVLADVLAAMSKPTVVTFPFVLLLLDYWPLDRFRNSSLKHLLVEKIPFCLISVVLSVLTFIGPRQFGVTVSTDVLPLGYRIQNAIASYGQYLFKSIWPFDLGIFYPLQKVSTAWLVGSAIALVGLTVFVLLRWKRQGYLAMGWLWFLGTMVPMIGFTQSGKQGMADRFTYIPCIGLCIAVSWLAVDLAARHWPQWKPATAAATALCLGLAVVSYFQTRHWVDTYTIFNHSIAVTEDNDFLHLSLAQMYFIEGKLALAMKHVKEAIRIEPNNSGSLWLGVQVGISSGKPDFALPYARQVAKLAPPGQTLPRRTLALLLWQTGHADEAQAVLQDLLRQDPNDMDTRSLEMMIRPR